MSFLYPQFLWALFALAIPVIIHLFNFKRYKTVYFSNNRLLRSVQTRSRSFNRLKHLLILTCRILGLTMLILAFAQPFIPAANADKQSSNYASIFIDNSLSMKSGGEDGSLLDQARTTAVNLIQSFPDDYKVQVITNNFEGKQQRFYTPAEAIKLVDEIQASHSYRDVDDVESRIEGSWQSLGPQSEEKLQVFMLSDFQRSQFSNLEILDKPEWNLNLIHLRSNQIQSNISIDSAWFEQPVMQAGFDQDLKVKLRNYGNSATTVPLKLEINGQLAGAEEFEVPADGSREVNFEIRPPEQGNYRMVLSTDAGEPLFDNEFYLSFHIGKPVRVVVIGTENGEALKRLFDDTAYNLSINELSGINYGQLDQSDLIILNQLQNFPSGLLAAVQQTLERGGNIVVLPALDNELSTNSLLTNLAMPAIIDVKEQEVKARNINYRDDIFRNVFNDVPENPQMPEVNKYAKFPNSTGFELISLENGDPLISRFPTKNGNVLLFAVNFNTDVSNLPRHPVIVPIMLNAALYSSPASSLYTAPGIRKGQEYISSGNNEIPLSIDLGDASFIPPQRKLGERTEVYNLPSDIEPGIFRVYKEDTTVGLIAVNIDRRESDWKFLSENDLKNSGLNITPKVLTAGASDPDLWENRYTGQPLWRWFILGSIVFLLLEILILKLWK